LGTTTRGWYTEGHRVVGRMGEYDAGQLIVTVGPRIGRTKVNINQTIISHWDNHFNDNNDPDLKWYHIRTSYGSDTRSPSCLP
jgi:hypothetical protein